MHATGLRGEALVVLLELVVVVEPIPEVYPAFEAFFAKAFQRAATGFLAS